MQEKNEIVIPEIAGVNSADGLKRVAGNTRLYLNLLAQFAEKQGDASGQISAALKGGDRKLAERIAHTVKGVAGNIGITEIQLAAATVEKAIRDEDPGVFASLEHLQSLLTSQVRVIREALPSRPPSDGSGAKELPFVAEEASAAVVKLKALLEANDGDAGEAFLGLQKAVGGHVQPALLEALGVAVSDFEFDTAITKLEQIASELSVPIGEG